MRMQDFVEKFVAERRAALEEKKASTAAAQEDARQKERDARLIRLGMCEKEYSPTADYRAEYPFQEYRTGKYYRLLPFAVSDEEYALICHYDDSPLPLKKPKFLARLFGGLARHAAGYALTAFLFGLGVSLFLGVVLFSAEGILPGLAAALLGLGLSFIGAVTVYTVGRTAATTEALLTMAEQLPETTDTDLSGEDA